MGETRDMTDDNFAPLLCHGHVELRSGAAEAKKVGWDNLKIYFIATEKGDKIQILYKKTVCIY